MRRKLGDGVVNLAVGFKYSSWFLGDLGFGLVSGWFRMVLGGFDKFWMD